MCAKSAKIIKDDITVYYYPSPHCLLMIFAVFDVWVTACRR